MPGDPLQAAIAKHKDLSDDAQKHAGRAIAGAMEPKHQQFLDLLLELLRKKDIDPADPKSFLNRKVFDALTEEERDRIDLALINLAHVLEDIVEFRLSTQTPDASPHLQTMIEELWQMKERIEKSAGDVFKF